MPERRPKGEGTYWKDPETGRWYCRMDAGRLPDGSRKRIKRSGGTRSEAGRRARAALEEFRQAPEQVTVGDLLDEYITHLERDATLQDTTVDQYRGILNKHVRPALGATLGRSVRVEDVERLWQQMAQAGCGRDLILKTRTQFNKAYGRALKRRLLDWNPVEHSEVPRSARSGQQARRSLNLKEVDALLAAASGERLQNLIVLLTCTGLRPSEALALRWSDYDATTGTLSITGAFKSASDRPLGPPKTKSGVREIVLPEVAQSALAAQAAQVRLERQPSWPERWSDLIFPSERGTPIDLANLRRFVRRLRVEAGIGDRVRPYELRHTATSLLADQGVPVEELADLLGHASTRTVPVYRHRLRSVDAARRLDGVVQWSATPPSLNGLDEMDSQGLRTSDEDDLA
jgi:integrase